MSRRSGAAKAPVWTCAPSPATDLRHVLSHVPAATIRAGLIASILAVAVLAATPCSQRVISLEADEDVAAGATPRCHHRDHPGAVLPEPAPRLSAGVACMNLST